ncbi:unnamed protein product, partial [Polarella glacialis]
KARAREEEEEEEEEVHQVRSSSQSSRRPRRATERRATPPPSWDHPEGLPFEDLEVDSTVTGVVVNISEFGVFADIGYERNIKVGCQARYWKRFRRGDILEDLVVTAVSLESRKASASLEDAEAALEANRAPLEDLREGSLVDGVVDQKNQFGVFVNIGAEHCHGRLQ